MGNQKGTGRTIAVSALKAESQTLQQHVNQLDLAVSGMGNVAVDNCLEELTTQNISGLISWGVCGALKPELKPGDLLIPKTVMNQSKQTFECDDIWRREILTTLPSPQRNSSSKSTVHSAFTDSIITDSKTVLTTPATKMDLAESSSADAVDMESFTIAKFADQHSIPFVIIRAVIDTVDDTLPSASAFRPGQSSASVNTLFSAISRPAQWPALIRTGGQFKTALASLNRLADSSINALCMPSNQASKQA